MGARLVVDLDLLERTGREIGALRKELDGHPDLVDDVPAAAGHSDLSEALGDFGGNWSFRRRNLTGSLEVVATMATESAEAYRTTDTALGQALRSAP